ncbi:hypothetical protein DRV84_00830 [Rhodosalinus sediminis]|uniref:AAA+ family ATPase n=1 Tax=Rhodosalinus sediminis TaxID=1940533 RepID=A0A3D9BZ37_9RHOB|nr:hypothetical protein [Rhodosalinus sediminis]REC58803.1 hypothetical protein DRV84_00830 [Rhodosalinus sediminis]
MTRAVLALILALAAAPLAAEEAAPAERAEDGRGLMEEGARLFFRGLMSELDPALDELEGMAGEIGPAVRDFAREMGPALAELLERVEDWSAYHPPEMLPNGDIILRRKEERAPPPPEEEEDAAPPGPVEL